MSLKEKIAQTTLTHICHKYGENTAYANSVLSAVKALLATNIHDYKFPVNIDTTQFFESSVIDFQDALAKINEKEARRKKEGVYYTDRDVTDFLAANTLLHYVRSAEKKVYGTSVVVGKFKRLTNEQKMAILNATTIDPTCGTGEFLLSVLGFKILLYKQLGLNQPNLLCNTIFGNDIEDQSTEITKLRVFFMLIDSLGKIDDPLALANILNHNFTNIDAVNYQGNAFGHKDIFIGNPPYVEYRNFEGKTHFDYGNVYADVLHHSVDNLTDNGIMAYVIPLSYVSTIRMSKIRNHICKNTNKQIVMNFADRPDCLFSCVHQKLTIVIAQRNANFSGILSSSYKYWYQAEREELFNNITLNPTLLGAAAYWPKLGNKTETSIYQRFLGLEGRDILTPCNCNNAKDIYINQRACFWMKVFARDMNSNSYSKYSVPSELQAFAYCLMNSSLFFLLWVIISDGWHVTNKELGFIKFPHNIGNESVWQKLMQELGEELENTKVFVNTKQVDYEYKHKLCKKTIDQIDDEIAKVYRLSSSQLKYIKEFGLKYRTSDGA